MAMKKTKKTHGTAKKRPSLFTFSFFKKRKASTQGETGKNPLLLKKNDNVFTI